MSWYDITYACGHTDREQIYGKTSDRQNRADWLGNNKVCRPCWIRGRAEADKKRALERAGLATTTTTAAAVATEKQEEKNENKN